MNEKNLKLYQRLVSAETALEVREILIQEEYWDNLTLWRPFADNENNFSQIGNQQSEPVAAIVEKLVNSIDATLMNIAQERGIKPNDKECPSDMREAVAAFVENKSLPCGDRDGLIYYWEKEKIQRESQNISIYATGKSPKEGNPCLIIADKGEGQTPDNFPNTFLSLSKQNKLRIPYVQGKFNMGGTGVFQFCEGYGLKGEKIQLQLLLSRRNPKLLSNSANERDKSWGFTIVRRVDGRANLKSPVFEYLAPVELEGGADGLRGVLTFQSSKMPIFPSDDKDRPRPHSKNSEYGSLVKLYEYAIKEKTNLIFAGTSGRSLLVKLEEGLISCALPIQVAECRTHFNGRDRRSFVSELLGSLTELGNMAEDKKKSRLELIEPIFGTIRIKSSALDVHVYVYKEDPDSDKYNSKGVFFTVNGQTHAKEERNFFSSKKVNLGYIRDSIFVIVDCTNLDNGTRSDLFMNSRDRMRETPFKEDLYLRLQEFLGENETLQALNRKRQQERVQRGLEDQKPLEETLRNLVKSNPRLAELLPIGVKIPIPSMGQGTGEYVIGDFEGKKHPTFFRFKKNKVEIERTHPINQSMRIGFETDVKNNYFSRKLLPGKLQIRFNGLFDETGVASTVGNLNNGVLTVVLDFDQNQLQPGNEFEVIFEINDETLLNPFINICKVRLENPHESNVTGGKGKERSSNNTNQGRGGQQSAGLPNVIPIDKASWSTEQFNELSAMKVKQSPDGSFDFYYNKDNRDLLEVQNRSVLTQGRLDPNVYDHQYKIGLMLIAFSLINQIKQPNSYEDISVLNEEVDVEQIVYEVTKAISPYWLTIIEALGGQRFISTLSES
jgi:hypothetical protein